MRIRPRPSSARVIGLAAVLLVCGPAHLARAEELGANKSDLIRGLLPTVVNIATAKLERPVPTPDAVPAVGAAAQEQGARPTVKNYVGSGFIIDPTGLIVTNYHVVKDAYEVVVALSDGTRLPAKMLSASRLADLALLKITADHPLPAAHWGDSDVLQVGDQVFAAGNPFGIGLSVSAGIISGLNRDIKNSPYDDLIQTDATINHGNSGGPLFDMQGNVIGVDSAILSPTTGSSGLGFAIPSNSARFVIDRLQTYGWVRPAWIGLKLQEVTPDIGEAMGLRRAAGSIVAWVLPTGPAKKAGLQIGDVVLRYNGAAPTDERALLRAIAHTTVGDTVTLRVRRQDAEHDVPVVVEAWPRDQWDARDAPVVARRPTVVIPPDLGLTLSRVSPPDRAKLGLEAGLDGVLVTGVAAESDPAGRGMVSGDVILRVQDKPVATPADVQAAIDAARARKRGFVGLLILPKQRDVPGPKWLALRLDAAGG